ncbi:MAG: hypothetical protein STSR0009_00110 [Methanoregula sp.]
MPVKQWLRGLPDNTGVSPTPGITPYLFAGQYMPGYFFMNRGSWQMAFEVVMGSAGQNPFHDLRKNRKKEPVLSTCPFGKR